MSKFEQLQQLIGTIEDTELKSKLETTANGAFTDITNLKNDMMNTRDELRSKLRDKNELVDAIQSKLKLDDGFNADDIVGKIKGNDKIEEVETRYKQDLETLRTELAQRDNTIADINTKFEDTLFTNSINGSGELNNFVDDAMARNMILSEYKSKTILEDGKLYKRDEVTGKIATDAISGDKLGIDMVTKDIVSKLNPMYVKPEIIANGGGSKPTVQATTGKKPSEYTETERVNMFRDNPEQFRQIFNKK